ncbi:DUF397 domain-containing protein [Glycomyces sp. YM15]|uniref:DUF397 domain-containing protein n=1 Tax=Glycomyces sp. YM15 TaxID=2800446 RepID=UPI0019635E77|nr:DUF397 domain-containing protein [Glycomyces sp. YM15]
MWHRSIRSADTGNGDCVEARPAPAGFELLDSKLGSDSPIFDLPAQDFTTPLRAVSLAPIFPLTRFSPRLQLDNV